MANLFIAYVLWLFGGWLGLHHFYLGRDKHAFIWWTTWGGCCGLGWIRDLWRIPEYVNAANKTPGYLEELNERARRYPTPVFSVVRFGGELTVGFLFGLLVRLALPEEFVVTYVGHLLSITLPPIGVAIGVHLVGNVSPEKVNFQWALFGSYVSFPLLNIDSGNNLVYSAILSAIFVNWKGKEWNRDFIPKRGVCKRISILTVYGLIYLSLWSSTIYLNAKITTKEGDEVPLRDAIHNFFTSPAWEDTKQSFWNLYNYYQAHGWSNFYDKIVESLDPLGEANAYKVLDLTECATEEEIKARYKELAKKWHPDKEKDPEKKSAAQEKFIEIKQAYDTLSQIAAQRARRNKQSRKHEHTEF